mgnify:FL=1
MYAQFSTNLKVTCSHSLLCVSKYSKIRSVVLPSVRDLGRSSVKFDFQVRVESEISISDCALSMVSNSSKSDSGKSGKSLRFWGAVSFVQDFAASNSGMNSCSNSSSVMFKPLNIGWGNVSSATVAVVVGAAVAAAVGAVVGVVAANAAVSVSSAGLLAFAHTSAPHSTTAMTAAAAIQSFFPDFSPAFGFGSD